ncbi:L-lactate permease [compost metagenome]
MRIWNQVYNPVDNIWVSAIIAGAPLIFFIVALTLFKLKGYTAGILSTIVAAFIALFFYDMPLQKVIGSGFYGLLTGLWPVASIVVAAIFLYKLTVKTGKFEIMKNSITSVTQDQRLQVLLVSFCFGAFLEGAAGFGAPVAITAVILIGLGFKPIYAAGLCLIANIAGGAYGAMGIPVTTPSSLTDISALEIASRTSYIIPFVSFVVAFVLVFIIDGFKGIKQTWPAILVCGGTFAIVQFAVLNTIGPVLVDIISALLSLVALTLFLRVWKPKEIYRINQEQTHSAIDKNRSISFGQTAYAWLPFLLLTVLVIIFSLKPFKALFSVGGALQNLVFRFPIRGVHEMIYRHPPIVKAATPYGAVFHFDLFSSTTTAIILAALITIIIYRIPGKAVKEAAAEAVNELLMPIITICSVLAFAYICNYSGMSSTLGLAFASTAGLFPLFSPILGWIGVFLTGSVVNCGSLFAPLQAVTASQIGISSGAMVAANVIGGDMAKMISPQSVAVASAAVGLGENENQLFRYTIRISLVFLALTCIVNWLLY